VCLKLKSIYQKIFYKKENKVFTNFKKNDILSISEKYTKLFW